MFTPRWRARANMSISVEPPASWNEAAMPVDLWKERVAKGDFWQAVAVMVGGPGLLPKLLFFSPMVMRSRWRLKLACYGM